MADYKRIIFLDVDGTKAQIVYIQIISIMKYLTKFIDGASVY